MMVLYYDCFSGISGDMNLGAMIDLGVDPDFLKTELQKLKIGGYQLIVTKESKQGIEGTRVQVRLEDSRSNKLLQGHHFKVSSPKPENQSILSQATHSHRTYKDIKALIETSDLSQFVKQLSKTMFHKVAEAEGKIHGKPIEDVHFHEVGAIDSIVDIVGAAICIEYLKPDKIISSPPQLGGGFVKCEHGTFPVPAPATIEILKNIPTRLGAVSDETTTPTGAAILATLCNEFVDKPELNIKKVAYGIGYKTFNIPNVLRVILSEDKAIQEDWLTEESSLVECNIDDMSPERYDYILAELFRLGADDVFLEPIYMKKNRPAQKLCIIVKPSLIEPVIAKVFKETTTLGVRLIPCTKKMMQRKTEILETEWGKISVKYGILNGKKVKFKPEYDDCAKVAQENNISLQDVYAKITKQISLE